MVDLQDNTSSVEHSQYRTPTTQPTGLAFFLGTWSGRIILFNTVIFLLMSFESDSFVMPTSEVLIKFGAKDPVSLAQGELWRYITPLFVHIGLIHYAFNTWALYVIGYQIEAILRGRVFLLLYLASGVCGNIASAVFSVSTSAGASSALFGLLGCGLFMERTLGKDIERKTGRRARMGAYTAMVLANAALGFFIPQIDNAAHFGGLVAGIAFTFALTSLIPNRLRETNKSAGIGTIILITSLAIYGAYLGSSSGYLQKRLENKMRGASSVIEKFHYLSDLVRLDPENLMYHYQRLRLLYLGGYPDEAAEDLNVLLKSEEGRGFLEQVRDDLYQRGMFQEAEALNTLLQGA